MSIFSYSSSSVVRKSTVSVSRFESIFPNDDSMREQSSFFEAEGRESLLVDGCCFCCCCFVGSSPFLDDDCGSDG